VTAINTKTNTVVGKPPRLLRPNTANNQTNTVSVINTAANAVITAVPVGTGPHMVAVTPDGSRVYVPNLGVDTVSVIDPATNTVISTIPPGGLRYQPRRGGQPGRPKGLRHERLQLQRDGHQRRPVINDEPVALADLP
jgi:hypothetical protein